MIRNWLLVLPILLVHLILLTNTRFTLWPEMVVYPYLINKGFELYTEIINPYPPLFLGLLSVFGKTFGYSPNSYQLLTYSVILFIDILIFTISKKLFGIKRAFFSLLFFTLLSIPFGVNGLWFDLVQIPLLILSAYFLFQFRQNSKDVKKLFFSVLFLAVAFFIKQQVIWLIPLYIFSLYKTKHTLKFIKIVIITSPLLMLTIFHLTVFWSKGLLDQYLFWSFYFPFFKASAMPGYVLFPSLRQFLAAASLFVLFLPVALKKQTPKLFLGFSLFSVLFAYPRFDFFHLLAALSFLSLYAGPNLNDFFKAKTVVKTLCILSATVIIFQISRYFQSNWSQETRFFDADIYQASEFLKSATTKNQTVYIQNGPDQLYPLTDTLPPKPWADEFPWYLEIIGLQKEVIEGINKENPTFIVSKPAQEGEIYEIGVYRPKLIDNYIEENYKNFLQISDTLWLKIKK